MKRKQAEESRNYYTYTYGPTLITPLNGVTTKVIVRIIDKLHELFGPGYEFRPEPITEGGIQMCSWPGRTGGYKSFRFEVSLNFASKKRWPLIDANSLNGWRNASEAEPIWAEAKRCKFTSFLKAFYGAPCWTNEEVNKLCAAFKDADFLCCKKPKITRSKGTLGEPQ